MNNIYHYPNKQRKTDATAPVAADSADTRAIVDSVQVQRFAVEFD